MNAAMTSAACSSLATSTLGFGLMASLALSGALPSQAPVQGMVHNTTRSVTGGEANDYAYEFALSADGRYFAFASSATNLVPNDTNGFSDIFVRDMQNGRILRVNTSNSGAQANGESFFGDISADGRWIVYTSDATNIAGTDNNGIGYDVFIADISGFVNGTGGAFATRLTSGTLDSYSPRIGILATGQVNVALISDAALVSTDTNGLSDVYVRQVLPSAAFRRVSFQTNGLQRTNGEIYYVDLSSDSRFLAYVSDSTQVYPSWGNGISQAYMVDNVSGLFGAGWAPSVQRLSIGSGSAPGNDSTFTVHVNNNGHAIFESNAGNLVANDTNAIVTDAFYKSNGGPIARVNVGPSGAQTGSGLDYGVFGVDLSDGANPILAIVSDAAGIVSGDTNAAFDVFVGRPGALARVKHYINAQLTEAYYARISGNGQRVGFFSTDTTLPLNTGIAGVTDGPFIAEFDRYAREGARTASSVSFEYRCAADNGLPFLMAFGLNAVPGTLFPGDTRTFPLSGLLGSPVIQGSPITGGIGTYTFQVPPGVFGSGLSVWVAALSLTSPTTAVNGVKGITNPVRFVL